MKTNQTWLFKANGSLYCEFIGTELEAEREFERWCAFYQANHRISSTAKLTMEEADMVEFSPDGLGENA